MYKPADKTQTSFLDFNQPLELHLNPDNRWIQMAGRIPWDLFEVKYAGLFPSGTGNVEKPLCIALGKEPLPLMQPVPRPTSGTYRIFPC